MDRLEWCDALLRVGVPPILAAAETGAPREEAAESLEFLRACADERGEPGIHLLSDDEWLRRERDRALAAAIREEAVH